MVNYSNTGDPVINDFEVKYIEFNNIITRYDGQQFFENIRTPNLSLPSYENKKFQLEIMTDMFTQQQKTRKTVVL